LWCLAPWEGCRPPPPSRDRTGVLLAAEDFSRHDDAGRPEVFGAADADGGACNSRAADADGGSSNCGAVIRNDDGGNSAAAVGDDDARCF